MLRLFQLAILLLLFVSCQTSHQKTDLLRIKLAQIISGKDAMVGVSIIGTNGKDTISVNGERHFPLQSVFKLHIALAVLSEIDKGNLSLEQKIEVQKKELFQKE